MFSELKGNGRLWIYTANRPLNEQEAKDIQAAMDQFIKGWNAHGASLHAGFTIAFNQVLILAVDEFFEPASGCSIDSSIAEFKKIDSSYHLDLFNRLNIPFLNPDKSIRLIPLSEINEAYAKQLIGPDSEFIDTTINSLDDLRSRLITTVARSWLARKIKQLA